MLHNFIAANRTILIDRCRALGASRGGPRSVENESTHGIAIFLDQLIDTLRKERPDLRNVDSAAPSELAIGSVASVHGRHLLDQGFALEHVVRDYADICQAVTNLACDTGARIDVDEFRIFNRCLDEAIAGAVTGYESQRAAIQAEDSVKAISFSLGPLAHELRNYLLVATHAFRAIKGGKVATAGSTAAALERSLLGMTSLIDRTLAEVRANAGLPPRLRNLSLIGFISEVQIAAALDPQSRNCQLTVAPIDADLTVFADAEMLSIAVRNLLQNAFKFTKPHTEVAMSARELGDRIIIEVADHCGGLPDGPAERWLQPFEQGGQDRSGLGLGLDICRHNVEAHNGLLKVHNVPGSGCVFTIDLPRHEASAAGAG